MDCPTVCSSPFCGGLFFLSEEKAIKSKLPIWKGIPIKRTRVNLIRPDCSGHCSDKVSCTSQNRDRSVENMPEKEAKIAQVSTEGGTDVLLKWIILTMFLAQKKKKKSNARDDKTKHSLNNISFTFWKSKEHKITLCNNVEVESGSSWH